jgi:hypothetical protein
LPFVLGFGEVGFGTGRSAGRPVGSAKWVSEKWVSENGRSAGPGRSAKWVSEKWVSEKWVSENRAGADRIGRAPAFAVIPPTHVTVRFARVVWFLYSLSSYTT